MSRPRKDLRGFRYGSMTVIDTGSDARGSAVRICLCDCGNIRFKSDGDLRRGRGLRCSSCAQKESGVRFGEYAAVHNVKHGHARRGAHSKEFRTWASMIRRCELPSQEGYPHYGGRGITVAPEWRSDFPRFLADVGPAPSDKHSLDRIDVNGDYEPGNVRWATAAQQARNKRNNRLIEHGGEVFTLTDLAEHLGVQVGTLWARAKYGRDLQTGRRAAPAGAVMQQEAEAQHG